MRTIGLIIGTGSAVLTLAGPAGAQVRIGGRMYQGTPPDIAPIVPDGGAVISVQPCVQFDVPYTHGLMSLTVTAENSSLSLEAEFADTPEEIAQVAIQNGLELPPVQPCLRVIEDYGHVHGGISLYTFAAGGGFSGGFVYLRRAEASVDFQDSFVITSLVGGVIECPVSLGASCFAAESFGNPNGTYGRVTLNLSGTFAGEAFAENAVVESVTVIPEQLSVGIDRTVVLDLQPGVNVFPISLTGQIMVEVRAESAGLFGFISGSATAGADFPDSIRIGRFRGVGGGPLPEGLEIRSQRFPELVYESTVGSECASDINGDGEVNSNDYFAFLEDYFAGTADFNGDGATDSDDFFAFLSAFFEGC